MRITILGSAACLPEGGNDSTHYLLDDRILLDCGWNAAGNLRDLACDMSSLHALLLTHTHHDHILGLPGFLFQYLLHHGTLTTLSICGPAETQTAVERALDTLQLPRFYGNVGLPRVHILRGGEALSIGGYAVRALEAHHPVPALCYRIEKDGAAVGFTGDTSYFDALPAFFTGTQRLFAECSFGVSAAESDKQALGHLDLTDAQRIAGEVPLSIVHLTADKRAALPEGTDAPLRGDTYTV